jgi:hypothetical protein
MVLSRFECLFSTPLLSGGANLVAMIVLPAPNISLDTMLKVLKQAGAT